MTVMELAKDRPTIQHRSVPSLAETLTAMPKSTTAAESKLSGTTKETMVDRAKKNQLFRRANLPERAVVVAGSDGSSPSWKRALQHATEQCKNFGIVLLCGERWTGKTVMATAIALDFLASGKGAVYTRGIGLLKDLRLDFNSNDLASRELVKPYQRWHLLIVDEVGLRVKGEAGYSESDAALLTDLVDQRYANRLATIFISNESPALTFEKLGPSITRRIEESGIVIEANWPSFNC